MGLSGAPHEIIQIAQVGGSGGPSVYKPQIWPASAKTITGVRMDTTISMTTYFSLERLFFTRPN